MGGNVYLNPTWNTAYASGGTWVNGMLKKRTVWGKGSVTDINAASKKFWVEYNWCNTRGETMHRFSNQGGREKKWEEVSIHKEDGFKSRRDIYTNFTSLHAPDAFGVIYLKTHLRWSYLSSLRLRPGPFETLTPPPPTPLVTVPTVL